MASWKLRSRSTFAKLCKLAAITGLIMGFNVSPPRAETLIFHASQSGKQTLDQGEGGGNPFASGLIELLSRPSLTLAEVPSALRALTYKNSKGFQVADVPASTSQGNYLLTPPREDEKRVALVMVVSDYAKSEGAKSLPGARNDANRIAAALRRSGFETEIALDFRLDKMRNKLASFRAASSAYDLALIYTTGHGVEVGGTVFLLPGDYPVVERNSALRKRALPLPEIAQSSSAKLANLIFYGGCRDDPLGQ